MVAKAGLAVSIPAINTTKISLANIPNRISETKNLISTPG